MPANSDRPQLWKKDVSESETAYNDWFLRFTPTIFQAERARVAHVVQQLFSRTDGLTTLTPEVLQKNPSILPILRMATCPPIGPERLAGLCRINPRVIDAMEEGRFPARLPAQEREKALKSLCAELQRLLDLDLMPWLNSRTAPHATEMDRSATAIADRLCSVQVDGLLHHACQQRQLSRLKAWLQKHGYRRVELPAESKLQDLEPGSFTVQVHLGQQNRKDIDVDLALRPSGNRNPVLLMDLLNSGDFRSQNRRKREQIFKQNRIQALQPGIPYVLLLSGCFDTGFLGAAAGEGMDWIWEHRLEDLGLLGVKTLQGLSNPGASNQSS